MSVSGNGDRFNGPWPKNPQAERALLASVWREPACLTNGVARIIPDHFATDAHAKIFQAIRDLTEAGKVVDLVTVNESLHERGQIEDVGGYGYLVEVWNDFVTAANAHAYAQIVLDYFQRRQLIGFARDLESKAWTGPLDEALEDLARQTEEMQPAAGGDLDEADAGQLAADSEGAHVDYLPLLGTQGYIVRGWSHLVAGYPRCGKTELLVACCRDWLAMGETVLYLTEEPRSIWQLRLTRAPNAWEGLRLIFALGADPKSLLARVKRGGERIVVIDSIRNLGLIGQDECDNSELARALNPWVAAARQKGKTLIFLHHHRKGGGEHGEGIAGGHAMLGVVDIALNIERDTAPRRRLIKAQARVIDPAQLLYEKQEDGIMKPLGSPESVSLADVRNRVRDGLDEEWLTTKEVTERLGDPKPSAQQLREALKAEAEAGTIERTPPMNESAQGKTVRWRRPVEGERQWHQPHFTP